MDIQPLRLLERCPLCQVAYKKEDVRKVGTQDKTKLYHCTCLGCGHAVLAVILEGSGWMSSIGVITDLQAIDATRLQPEPISSDECIEICSHIAQDSQKLSRLFYERARSSRRQT